MPPISGDCANDWQASANSAATSAMSLIELPGTPAGRGGTEASGGAITPAMLAEGAA